MCGVVEVRLKKQAREPGFTPPSRRHHRLLRLQLMHPGPVIRLRFCALVHLKCGRGLAVNTTSDQYNPNDPPPLSANGRAYCLSHSSDSHTMR